MSRAKCPANRTEAAAWSAERLLQRGAEILAPGTKQKLAQMGLLPMKGRSILWPGDGSLMAAWLYCEEKLLLKPTSEEFDRYRRAKRILKATSLPPTAGAIRLAQEFAGGRPLTRRHARELLGDSCKQAHIEAAGLSGLRRVGRGKPPPAQPSDLIALFPEVCRARLLASLEQDVWPRVVPPTQEHAGRALGLQGAPCRIFAAAGLLAVSASRLGRGMSSLYLTISERLDQLVPGDSQRDASIVTDALDAAADADPTPAMARSLYQLSGMTKKIVNYLRSTLEEDAGWVEALLPATHLREQRFRSKAWLLCDSAARAGRIAKQERVVALAPSLEGLLIVCDNRVAQVETIFLELSKARRERSTGDQPIKCIGPVVRKDGSLGVGQQIVRFAVRTEGELLDAAHASDVGDATVAEMRRNRQARADRSSREHLVYLDTVSLEPGGECVEPFFIDVIRLGLLDDGLGLTREQEEVRSRMLERAGLPMGIVQVNGVLHPEEDKRRLTRALRRAMRADAPVIVDVPSLLYGLGIARIVVGMGIRGGARIHETRQLRTGCFSKETRYGRQGYVATLKPKGWTEEASYDVHASTIEQIRRTKRMAQSRWFPGESERGKPALPIVPFNDWYHPNMPAARYILVGRRGVLTSAQLGVLVRFLFIGVADVLSHDLRYLFVTRLGMDGESIKEIGAAAHHRPGSYTTARYDLSGKVPRGVEAAGEPFEACAVGVGRRP